MNPVSSFPLYFPKIHSNIIFPSTASWLWRVKRYLQNNELGTSQNKTLACHMP